MLDSENQKVVVRAFIKLTENISGSVDLARKSFANYLKFKAKKEGADSYDCNEIRYST